MIKALSLWLYLLVFMFGGCASLPQVSPLPEDEARVARHSFSQMLSEQWSCPGVLDADVSVTFQSFVFSGTVPGYLQAMRPSFLRFEGINPFGLTETVLVTDGSSFSYLVTREQQGYEGDLLSKTARRYIPTDLSTHTGYYWLIGKIPPGKVNIFNAGRDYSTGNIWFDVQSPSGVLHKVLYSEKERVVLRHLALDQEGEVEVDVSYTYPAPALSTSPTDNCPLPQQIDIEIRGNGKIILALNKLYPADKIDESQFLLKIPADYKRTVVK